ncbi:MAG: NADPH-dependent FMN reductase [Myxococcota bacterium]
MFKIAIIVGSLRKDSINLKLAKALIKLGQNKFEAQVLPIHELPLFNQDLEADFPAAATQLKQAIQSADGVLIFTPEYNRSIPGPLKNAIDWASRPYGANAFAQKPVGVIGASGGGIATACAQHSLRPVLNYLDTILMGQPEAYIQFTKDFIDDSGNISNESSLKFLTNYVDKFCEWVARSTGE